MLCTRQLVGVEMDNGHGHLHSNHYGGSGSTVDSQNAVPEQVTPASGSHASSNLSQLASHCDIGTSYAGLYYQQQQQHPASNHETVLDQLSSSSMMRVSGNYPYVDTTEVGPRPNGKVLAPYAVGPVFESRREQPLHILGVRSVSIMRSSPDPACSGSPSGTVADLLDTTRGSCKGKNAVEVPENCNYVNEIPNSGSSSLSFSLNSGMQNWHGHFEVGFNLMDATNFHPPEHRSGFLPAMEGTQRTLRPPNIIGLQMDSPFLHHQSQTHLFQGNYFGPTFQAGNTWANPFSSNVGVHPMWNYSTIPCLEGSNLCAGPPEISSMGVHQGSVGRTAFVFHPPSLHGQHQHLQPVQGMQAPNYSHHPRALSPSYGLPVNNLLHHGIINTSRDCADVVTRTQRPFPSSIGEWSYRPHRQLPQASTDLNDDRMRILSTQDNAVLALHGFYATEEFFDRHRDMRLDIDNMSYEELLALEEQIGDVKTGLPEEAISKNLRTWTYPAPSSLLNVSSGTVEIGTCIICQVEFAENERIGTLHCGHDYHADCIKQWLLVKNLCPICKTSAFDTDEREM